MLEARSGGVVRTGKGDRGVIDIGWSGLCDLVERFAVFLREGSYWKDEKDENMKIKSRHRTRGLAMSHHDMIVGFRFSQD